MIFDTLYLLFKSDASTVKAEVASLEKQIESLKAKGKQRSEQENKDLKEAVARQKELASTLKESQREGSKLVDSITDATAALVSFAAVRSGLISSSKFNSDLKVQSDLLGQNARDLDVYAEAAKAAGGSVEGFMGNIGSWSNALLSAGIKPGNFKDWLKAVQDDLAKYEGDEKRMRLKQYDFITDPGLQRMLLNPEEFKKRIAQSSADSQARQEDFERSRHTQELLSSIDKNIQGIWIKISRYLPDSVNAALQGPAGTALEAIGGFAILKRLLGGGAAAGAAGAAGGGLLSSLGAILGFGAAGWQIGQGINDVRFGTRNSYIGKASKYVSGKIDNYLHGDEDAATFAKYHPVKASSMFSDLEFWMSKGYTREQAAAIMGNMQAESAGNPAARGDGGRAHGLFQWHPDRRARIFKGTGIDISTASKAEQLEAAAWEMKNGVNGYKDDEFRKIKDFKTATQYFGRKYEGFAGSHDPYGTEMMRRVGYASNALSNQALAKSGGSNVTVGNITVNTQATDARGIAQDIGNHLSSVLKQVAADTDDGVKY